LLYRTTGLTDGEATTSVTTVLVPYNYDKDKVMVKSLLRERLMSLLLAFSISESTLTNCFTVQLA
ncbi:hypothetical protein, partial [Cronobacter malonaticus]|uniref:hypothetical protein n=1 Tax=Cronobacter malonaticus TaxID=413503 RepID=UPI001F1DE06F